MLPDAYAELAPYYDSPTGDSPPADARVAGFFRRLLADQGTRTLLDCACGTGRYLRLFHSLGLEATGSDLSPAMLAEARKNLTRDGIDLPLFELDYRELPARFKQRFDVVACLSSSILHMPNERELERALRSMHGVLAGGGMLVLTQGTSDRQWRERPRFILAADNAACSRLFVIDYVGAGACYNIVDIVRGRNDAGVRTWRIDYDRIYLRDDYDRLLRAVGFANVVFYGSYEFDPYDKIRSRQLIAVARR